MKLSSDHLLRTLAAHILDKIIPDVSEPYIQSSLGVIALMMLAAAEDFDRAAAVLIEENQSLRSLFKEAMDVVEDKRLKKMLEKEVQGIDSDFRVSRLNNTNQKLRAILIDLHSKIELIKNEKACRVEDAIWNELKAGLKRRSYVSWPDSLV
jgi:hypothetical protein